MTRSRHSAEYRVASIRPTTVEGYRHAEISVTHRESRKDASSNVTTVGTRSSTLRQPRLAQPIKTMLGILWVLVDGETFPAVNCKCRVDPQHLRGFGSRLLKLSRLRICGGQEKMRPLQIGQARCAFAQQTH